MMVIILLQYYYILININININIIKYKEIMHHNAIISAKCESFVERIELSKRMNVYLKTSKDTPLVVYGQVLFIYIYIYNIILVNFINKYRVEVARLVSWPNQHLTPRKNSQMLL